MTESRSGSVLVVGGVAIVVVAGLLRLTLIQTPVMLVPAFVGLIVCLVGVIIDG